MLIHISAERMCRLMTTFLPSVWTRLRTNFRNPVIRRNVAFYMGGKLLGLTLVLVIMWTVIPQVAHALGAHTTADMPTINAVNTVWTLVAAFLVFCMQVVFLML